MLAANIPLRFALAWAKNAGGAYIRQVPVASQIGVTAGAASYNDGFVPDNFTPVAAGGVPPFGKDMNGALNEMTTWDQWYQAGGPITYDATFSTAIGGYPMGAVLNSAIKVGALWYSTADNNTTNPDDPLTSANWSRVGVQVGAPTAFLTSSIITGGFVAMNGLTIGNVASGANYAAADALFLYVFNWNNFSNAQCPVTGGRGANGVADFNAGKAMVMPNAKGLGLIGADTMGGATSSFLTGVPVTSGNAATPGSILGENLHQLTVGELATHNHGITDPGHTHGIALPANSSNSAGALVSSAVTQNETLTFTTNSATTGIAVNNNGSNTPHNTVERSMIAYWGQKL